MSGELSGFACLKFSGGDHFLLCQRLGVKECLHRRLAEAPASLMRPFLIVRSDPVIKIGLKLLDRPVDLSPERDAVKLVEHRFVKALDDTIGLRTFCFCPAVIDIFHGKIEFVLMAFGIATIFRSAIGQHPQQANVLLVVERYHAVIEQLCRRERRLSVVELGKGDLGIGVNEGLLVHTSDAFQIAHIEGILRSAIAWMLAFEFA